MTAPHTRGVTGGGGVMKVEGNAPESREFVLIHAAAKGLLDFNVCV